MNSPARRDSHESLTGVSGEVATHPGRDDHAALRVELHQPSQVPATGSTPETESPRGREREEEGVYDDPKTGLTCDHDVRAGRRLFDGGVAVVRIAARDGHKGT